MLRNIIALVLTAAAVSACGKPATSVQNGSSLNDADTQAPRVKEKMIETLDADYQLAMFEVEAGYFDVARLVIKGESLDSTVSAIEAEQLATCKITDRKNVGDDLVLTVAFEAEIEDGENSCIVAVSNASFNSDIKLFVDVQD